MSPRPPARSRPSTMVHGRRVDASAAKKEIEERSSAVRRRDFCVAKHQRHRFGHLGQRRDCGGDLRGASNARPAAGQRLRGSDADRKPDLLEEVLHREHETPRQQQHVEEQRAHRGNTDNPENGPCRLTNQAAPRENEDVHRRARDSKSRRNSTQDAATLASAPSGTANPTHRRATSGVIRTNTSAVS